MDDLSYRYFVLAIADGEILEIAKMKTGDVAELLASALRAEFGK